MVFYNPEYIKDNTVKEKYILKRCVGLPNDKIEIKNYELYVNDVHKKDYDVIIESFEEKKQRLKKEMNMSDNEFNKYVTEYPDILKDPDNYKNYGPIIVSEYSFFCLGDNRTNSMDSRIWGLIKINSLYAKIKYIYWSNNIKRLGKTAGSSRNRQ